MSGAYSLFRLHPIHVHGKGEVAPEGYVSDAQREMMEAAQRGAGGKCLPEPQANTNSPATTSDPWGDLR
jgi:hypothetical protein